MAYLVKPIPLPLREEIAQDPFYSKCCLQDKNCKGRIQWHHHLKYGGKRQNVRFGILPICVYHHKNEKRKDIKEKLNQIMYSRATEKDKDDYSKLKWPKV